MATKNDISSNFEKKNEENGPKNVADDEKTERDYPENVQAPNYSQIQSPLRYRNAREYAQALQPWIHNYRMMSQMNALCAMMPVYYNMSCMNSGQTTFTGGQQSSPTVTNTATNRRSFSQSGSNVGVSSDSRTGVNGVIYRVPTFWRRVAAELIDFTLLFYMKLLVTLFVMKKWGHLYDSVDYQVLFSMEDLDYDKAFAITSEVIAMEIINRLLITMFETLCLRHGIGTIGGSTPGKRLLGLKLVSGEVIVDCGDGLVSISPATDVGWLCAFVRSAIKNFTIAFFLPACLTLFFNKHNRTIYDVVTKTIVVQNADTQHR